MEYVIEDLTKEDAEYIGGKINEIVPRETDADEEEFVLKSKTKTARSSADVLPRLTNTTGPECSLTPFGWMNAAVIRGWAL